MKELSRVIVCIFEKLMIAIYHYIAELIKRFRRRFIIHHINPVTKPP